MVDIWGTLKIYGMTRLLDTIWRGYVCRLSQIDPDEKRYRPQKIGGILEPCLLYALAIAREKMAEIPPRFFCFHPLTRGLQLRRRIILSYEL